jgi:hypothetical protein
MADGLHAPVPRRLRVRSSIQVAGTRVPASAFLTVMGGGFAGMVGVILGADFERVVWATGTLVLGGLLIVEGRLWGRSSHEVAAIVVRHARRQRRMRLGQQTIVLPGESRGMAGVPRRPRWEEADHARP